MIEPIKAALQHQLGVILNKKINAFHYQLLAGGSINHVYRLMVNDKERICCKINHTGKYPGMFEAEKAGLQLLAEPAIMRIPGVIANFLLGSNQVLLLEWIEQGTRTSAFWKNFGMKLSRLHNVQGGRFGLDHDNYMGALHQANTYAEEWPLFFYKQRLLPQIKIARDKDFLSTYQVKSIESMLPVLRDLFPDASPRLLHGDLWSGNFLCDEKEEPVLIDPAVYYGHPAVDLGLTTLFGGFDKAFYDAYNYYSPFPVNHATQWEVCNLYPLLIHLNLFGRSYLGDVLSILQKY
jgi:fructosamine-3-kinase